MSLERTGKCIAHGCDRPTDGSGLHCQQCIESQSVGLASTLAGHIDENVDLGRLQEIMRFLDNVNSHEHGQSPSQHPPSPLEMAWMELRVIDKSRNFPSMLGAVMEIWQSGLSTPLEVEKRMRKEGLNTTIYATTNVPQDCVCVDPTTMKPQPYGIVVNTVGHENALQEMAQEGFDQEKNLVRLASVGVFAAKK